MYGRAKPDLQHTHLFGAAWRHSFRRIVAELRLRLEQDALIEIADADEGDAEAKE